MKKGDTFIGLDGKRYRVGKTVWRKNINKEIAKMTPYTPPPPKVPWWAFIGMIVCGSLSLISFGLLAMMALTFLIK